MKFELKGHIPVFEVLNTEILPEIKIIVKHEMEVEGGICHSEEHITIIYPNKDYRFFQIKTDRIL